MSCQQPGDSDQETPSDQEQEPGDQDVSGAHTEDVTHVTILTRGQ